MIPLLLYLSPARYTRSGDVMVTLSWYFLAKLPEVAIGDHGIDHLGHTVSGPMLKHLAAVDTSWLSRMGRLRHPILSAASA